MSIALVIAAIAAALAFVLWIVAELLSPKPRWWIPAACLVALAGVVSADLVARAETPFGRGNGVVPDLVGEHWCAAQERLDERGLRARPCPEDETGSGREVQRQSPAPGTRLGAGGVVKLDSGCGDDPDGGCA